MASFTKYALAYGCDHFGLEGASPPYPQDLLSKQTRIEMTYRRVTCLLPFEKRRSWRTAGTCRRIFRDVT